MFEILPFDKEIPGKKPIILAIGYVLKTFRMFIWSVWSISHPSHPNESHTKKTHLVADFLQVNASKRREKKAIRRISCRISISNFRLNKKFPQIGWGKLLELFFSCFPSLIFRKKNLISKSLSQIQKNPNWSTAGHTDVFFTTSTYHFFHKFSVLLHCWRHLFLGGSGGNMQHPPW